jgi:2-keto-4-pentenoate hydratase/2-oxohepta-3-ene-1,7-dioic acid hydratase in catechol pathway
MRVGAVVSKTVVLPALAGHWPFAEETLLSVIERGPEGLSVLRDLVEGAPPYARLPLAGVEILAPIPRPRRNIMCLGWNYLDHARESARAFERAMAPHSDPVVFTKAVTTVNGPYADIPYDDQVSTQLDWEVELGVILGSGGRKIPRQDALGHVFGYTVINDISARDLQRRHKQFFLGKSLDGSCPMGPWIVTADEIPDPQRLGIRSRVNGVLKQDANTADQIFDVATTLSVLSRGMGLEPGDVIATGTPSGVGFARNPPEFLTPGDVVECEVERIGRLRNRVSQPR